MWPIDLQFMLASYPGPLRTSGPGDEATVYVCYNYGQSEVILSNAAPFRQKTEMQVPHSHFPTVRKLERCGRITG